MNIQERLTAFAMLGATWVLWLLVALSVVGLAIMFERAFFLFVSREDIGKLKSDLLSFLQKRDLRGAAERLKQSKSFEARVAEAGLESAQDGAGAAEERMTGQAQLAKMQMERNLVFLGTVGNNAPFVGLLGTVIGIIRAFYALEQGEGQVNPRLMSEVGEALVATAVGILVALPAVASFNVFQRIVKARIARADALGREVLAYLRSENSPPHAGAAE